MVVAQRKVQYEEVQPRESLHKEKKRVEASKKNKVQVSQKLQIIVSIVALVGLCVGMIFGYAQLTETKYRIYYLEKEANELSAQIENLKVELEAFKKTDIIEKQAKETLKMQYPQKDQIVYLSIENQPIKVLKEPEIKMKNMEKQSVLFFLKGMFVKMYALLD